MLEAAGSLRDRKKQATRTAIRRVALGLVAERGFAQVTVEDIAGAADVSPRTFFNYFPSKEAVILGFGPDYGDQIRRRLRERPSAEVPLRAVCEVMVQELEAMAAQVAELGGDRTDWVKSLRAAHADPHVRAAHASHVRLLEQAIARGVADRLRFGPGGEDDAFCVLLAGTAVGAVRAVMTIWAKSGGDLAVLARDAFEAISAGLPGPEDLPVPPDRSLPGDGPAPGES
jgi:AcrR family transcriptional regulator